MASGFAGVYPEITHDECYEYYLENYCLQGAASLTYKSYTGTGCYYPARYDDGFWLFIVPSSGATSGVGTCGVDWSNAPSMDAYVKWNLDTSCWDYIDRKCLKKYPTSHTKYMQEHTNGQGVVIPKEACEAFATAISLSYSETVNTATPQGCYVDASSPTETVVFNSEWGYV